MDTSSVLGLQVVVPPVVPTGDIGQSRSQLLFRYYECLEKYYETIGAVGKSNWRSGDVEWKGVGGLDGGGSVAQDSFALVARCCEHLCRDDERVERHGDRVASCNSDSASCVELSGVDNFARHDGSSTVMPGSLPTLERVETCSEVRHGAGQDGNTAGNAHVKVPASVDRVFDGSGSLGSVKGPNWERNQEWKRRHKEKKRNRAARKSGDGSFPDWRGKSGGFFDQCTSEVRLELANTRAQRFIAENKKAIVRANLDHAATQAVSLQDKIKADALRMRASVERNMVAIEKSHATLTATGNVPGDMTGFAATIIGSGSISPDSSASMAEFRACQKKLLDTEAKLDQVYASLGLDSLAKQREYFKANDLYTDNTENRDMFDEQGLDYVQDPYNEGKIYAF